MLFLQAAHEDLTWPILRPGGQDDIQHLDLSWGCSRSTSEVILQLTCPAAAPSLMKMGPRYYASLRPAFCESSGQFSPHSHAYFPDQSRCRDPQLSKTIHILILKIVNCSSLECLFSLTTIFIDLKSVFTLPLLLGMFKQAAEHGARTEQKHVL